VTLAKGEKSTLTPTNEALENGFYKLEDIKLVLEQSLVRTRATLTVGDVVHTWHRGKKFDLIVSSVTPSLYNAVSCINTDIEVEFGTVEDANDIATKGSTAVGKISAEAGAEGGHILSSSLTASSAPTKGRRSPHRHHFPDFLASKMRQLLPEPPAISDQQQSSSVCTVQSRAANGATGKRRFDVRKATVLDLFAFAASVLTAAGKDRDAEVWWPFQLVTRFPRRVLSLDEASLLSPDTMLANAGVQPGQELFMLERIQ